MKIVIGYVILGLFMLGLLFGSKFCPIQETPAITCQEMTKLQQDAYQEGANDALSTFALVALQSELERTNRTYAVMLDSVREKLSIEKTTK